MLAVVFLASGCGAKSTAESVAGAADKSAVKTNDTGAYKDGTYEGSSDKGIHPGLKVAVTIQGGKITEVKVVENEETPGIGSVAVEELPGKIVAAQSTNVEATSGASLSSAAIKEAVDKALGQAKK